MTTPSNSNPIEDRGSGYDRAVMLASAELEKAFEWRDAAAAADRLNRCGLARLRKHADDLARVQALFQSAQDLYPDVVATDPEGAEVVINLLPDMIDQLRRVADKLEAEGRGGTRELPENMTGSLLPQPVWGRSNQTPSRPASRHSVRGPRRRRR